MPKHSTSSFTVTSRSLLQSPTQLCAEAGAAHRDSTSAADRESRPMLRRVVRNIRINDIESCVYFETGRLVKGELL
jgi:hypothetical protein